MVRMRWRRSSRMMRIMRWMRRRRYGQCVLNSVTENKRILYETYLMSYVVYFCNLLKIYLNTLPRYGEIQYAGKNTCISGIWSVGVIILMCSGALRSGVGALRRCGQHRMVEKAYVSVGFGAS